jgi:hypothetical protein
VTSPPGDRDRIFVVERAGRVQIVRNDLELAQPFLNMSTRTSTDGERGLLSMAFAPDYASSGKFYVYYTGVDDDAGGPHALGDLIIDEYQRDPANSDLADTSTRREVLRIPHSAPNHNGGTITFGPDGYLYLATGDGGTGTNSQNLSSLLGKVLRIDPRGGTPYAIPPGNPFADGGGPNADEIWALGLRNPFRFSFDRVTGDLVIADVGGGTWEEVDFRPQSTGGGKGENFGWPTCEGRHLQGTSNPCTFASVAPVLEYGHTAPCTAITGGVVIRDLSLPQLYGRYIYGDECHQFMHTAGLGIPDATDDRDLAIGTNGAWVAFSETTGGCVYAVDLAGPIYRIAPAAGGTPCPDPPPGQQTTGGGNSGENPPGDTSAPILRATFSGRQRVFDQRGDLIVYATCDEDCSLFSFGTVSVPKAAASVFRLGKAHTHTRPGKRAKLRLRVPKRSYKIIKRALKLGERVTANVTIRAKDPTGNKRFSRRKIRLVR